MSNNFLKVKEQTQQERTLVTGVCNSNILAINPSKEELAEIIGRDVSGMKEPSYIGQNRLGDPNVRIDIWMKPSANTVYFDSGNVSDPQHKTYKDPYKLAIFLSDKEKSNKDETKNMFINGKVQTAWAPDSETAINYVSKAGNKWFSEKSVRVCKEGEDQLLDFFSKFTNADLRDDDTNLVFNDYDAILGGDTTELTEIVDAKNKEGKTINVLLGVRDGKYQEVYSYAFESGMRKTFGMLHKSATSEYNGFKAEFQNDTVLQSYVRPSSPSVDTSRNDISPNMDATTSDLF
jgi:hypothetical protein